MFRWISWDCTAYHWQKWDSHVGLSDSQLCVPLTLTTCFFPSDWVDSVLDQIPQMWGAHLLLKCVSWAQYRRGDEWGRGWELILDSECSHTPERLTGQSPKSTWWGESLLRVRPEGQPREEESTKAQPTAYHQLPAFLPLCGWRFWEPSTAPHLCLPVAHERPEQTNT